MKSESEFIRDAMTLIHTVSGHDNSEFGPDTDLQATGWFDSLLLITFLDFIETERCAPLPISDSGISMDSLATIRKAYQLVIAPA